MLLAGAVRDVEGAHRGEAERMEADADGVNAGEQRRTKPLPPLLQNTIGDGSSHHKQRVQTELNVCTRAVIPQFAPLPTEHSLEHRTRLLSSTCL